MAATTTSPKRRETPTEKQTAILRMLDEPALIPRALECLHSLNRRAKELRDRRNRYRGASFAKRLDDDIHTIYTLKDTFLDALVLAGRAAVYTFKVPWNDHVCAGCGRSWFGDSWCYACGDETGESVSDDWYVIESGGFRFHQPSVSSAAATRAIEIEPHEPRQPQREIPTVGLTIAAQRRCVAMATARLTDHDAHVREWLARTSI